MAGLSRDEFIRLIHEAAPRAPEGADEIIVPLSIRLLGDTLTPIVAYRRLVAPDERTAPSFLLESVEGGERQGRHSILGARPRIEVVARRHDVAIVDHSTGARTATREADPLGVPERLSAGMWLVRPPEKRRQALPSCALGGWFGYASYDTVRYTEPGRLPFDAAPPDDRGLPEAHFAFYDTVVAFDHVDKVVHAVRHARVPLASLNRAGEAFDEAMSALGALAERLDTPGARMPLGRLSLDTSRPPGALPSNTSREAHASMVARAQEYIRAGDIFQVVLGQRFERRSAADPFDVYRALRVVNPSPYMVYLQAEGCILIASSPEILCRVRVDGEQGERTVTNRPLAGTRPRGADDDEDREHERELLADEKERSEHVMLLDLGRNDVGRVARAGSVDVPAAMQIERYSHVMHISSTVTGSLRDGLGAWDVLRAALPAGTISGAPKIRAMQIIDELEPVRRGPYGGGFGYVALDGEMDIALALRTIVAPTAQRRDGEWVYHLQAAGGIVLDSRPDAEWQETVNKAAALARAVDLAESSLGRRS